MNLADPELELIDPTPNIHSLFLQFDQMFFWKKLASRAVVKWSKRMYSCAGVCSYEGRGGLCSISLSEPLLKLRPRKDLVETLLHEMIHAFLFVTCRDQDRDGHGPNFKAHMHRINSAAGLNISIYHSFHEEVELYQTHWWRCNGPCQTRKPHFGIVRRSTNRAPGPNDYWWTDHIRKCGGTFIKFKEPEKKGKKTVAPKPKGDITKFVKTTKTKEPPVGEPKIQAPTKSKIKVPKPVITKSNGSNTVVVTQKGITTFNDPAVKAPTVFTGKGHIITGSRVRSSSVEAAEVVRNVWANKQLSSVVSPISSYRGIKVSPTDNVQKTINNVNKNKAVKIGGSPSNTKAVKHKADDHIDSPPVKVKKIDDYFKSTATSLLKDIYGDNITIAESNHHNKLIAVHNISATIQKVVQVDCPICKLKFDENIINMHLDECLNKGIISELTTTTDTPLSDHETFNKMKPIKVEPSINYPEIKNGKLLNTGANQSKPALKEIYSLPEIPAFKGKSEVSEGQIMKKHIDRSLNTYQGTNPVIIKEEPIDLDENINWEDVMKYDIPKTRIDSLKHVTDKYLRKSDSFTVPKKEKDSESTFTPSFTAEDVHTRFPSIKKEPEVNIVPNPEHKCPCCGVKITKAIDEHLDECLAFFDSNATEPEEGASTSFANETIVIDDDDDDIDESQLLNATGTMFPCPCCLKMVEYDDMNTHIDSCLG